MTEADAHTSALFGQLDQESPIMPRALRDAVIQAQLMKKLDERDAFIAQEAERVSQGLEFPELLTWDRSTWELAVDFPLLCDRYYEQIRNADRLLVPPKIAPEKRGLRDTESPEGKVASAESVTKARSNKSDHVQFVPINEYLERQSYVPGLNYPNLWSRWMGNTEASHVMAIIDKGSGREMEFQIHKLDPKVYGGDTLHDLGLCQAHFTKGARCNLTWEQCPYRHWSIEPVEAQWIDPAWFRKIICMDRQPYAGPDYATLHYNGRPRQIRDGRWIQSALQGFLPLPEHDVEEQLSKF